MKSQPLIFACISLGLAACGSRSTPSSESVAEAQSTQVLVARYFPTEDTSIGGYKVREVWVERSERYKGDVIVVRLGGSHYGDEPRVRIRGMKEFDYLTIWSKRNGPPYEIWKAPDPLPSSVVLEREGKEITLEKK